MADSPLFLLGVGPPFLGGTREDDMRLLASGTFSTVEYLDLALASGYSAFKLILTELTLSSPNPMAFVLSSDGGSTWLTDQVNADSCSAQFLRAQGAVVSGSQSQDVQFALSEGNCDDNAIIEMLFFPGSATKRFSAVIQAFKYASDVAAVLLLGAAFNTAATSPIAAVRVNAIRILPYGNADPWNPTSNITISGSYFVYGVPAPPS